MLKNLNPARFARRVLYRIRQFFLAVTSRLTDDDLAFVRNHLTIPEMALFELLPRDEQKHSIAIARKMLSLAHGSALKHDKRVLAKAGLLHDVGKSAVKLGITDRAMLVVLRRMIRPVYDKLAEKGKAPNSAFVYRKFFVHREHGRIGAKALMKAGTEEKVISIVEAHDSPPRNNDPVELVFLRKIDNEN